MKRIIVFFALVAIVVPVLLAADRGLTTRPLLNGNERVVGAALRGEPAHKERQESTTSFDRDEWNLSDSLEFDFYLGADQNYGMKFWPNTNEVSVVSNLEELGEAAQQAVERSPRWLRPALRNVFCNLSPLNQDVWAAIINEADDPYIDEIAFCVAHTSTVYLQSDYAYPQLFVENAELIYEIDQDLSYVEIVDHGSSATDDDYYSTTSYIKIDESGNQVTVEVPRDVYYWYLVHPKITDDIPAYIDPALAESNTTHINNIADPPDGVFWRDFFYNHADEGYPLLSEQLANAQVMWARDGSVTDALGTLQNWVNAVMEFTSDSERPHQPVRIYRKHYGRCGEHADITTAAARTALMPCTGILSMSSDHTWNEFWEDGWVQWEPVNGYINTPLVYENGWGKVFGSVFEIRSDGFLTSVTDRYSEGQASITVNVLDANGNPVDGARIILAINSSLTADMVAFTDENGQHEFIVGEGNTYYARVETSIGTNPEAGGEYLLLQEDTVDGGEYAFQMPVAGTMPVNMNVDSNPPEDAIDDYRMMISFETVSQVIKGIVTWDDIDEVGERPVFYKELEDRGVVNCFTATSDNYLFYEMGINFEAFHSHTGVADGSTLFEIPASNYWCMFLDNKFRLNNSQCVAGYMNYYLHESVDTEDVEDAAPVFRLAQNHPNPFNPETDIAFSIADASPVKLEVFNIRGQKVCTLVDENMDAGIHRATWKGQDTDGRAVGSGVYLYKLSTSNRSEVKKMLMLK